MPRAKVAISLIKQVFSLPSAPRDDPMFRSVVYKDSPSADVSDEVLRQREKTRDDARALVQARVLQNVTTAHTLINSRDGGLYCPRRGKYAAK